MGNEIYLDGIFLFFMVLKFVFFMEGIVLVKRFIMLCIFFMVMLLFDFVIGCVWIILIIFVSCFEVKFFFFMYIWLIDYLVYIRGEVEESDFCVNEFDWEDWVMWVGDGLFDCFGLIWCFEWFCFFNWF